MGKKRYTDAQIRAYLLGGTDPVAVDQVDQMVFDEYELSDKRKKELEELNSYRPPESEQEPEPTNPYDLKSQLFPKNQYADDPIAKRLREAEEAVTQSFVADEVANQTLIKQAEDEQRKSGLSETEVVKVDRLKELGKTNEEVDAYLESNKKLQAIEKGLVMPFTEEDKRKALEAAGPDVLAQIYVGAVIGGINLLINADKGIKGLFSDSPEGLSAEKTKEYKKLTEEVKKAEKPIAEYHNKRLDKKMAPYKDYLAKKFTHVDDGLRDGQAGGGGYINVPTSELSKYNNDVRNIPKDKLIEYERKYIEAESIVRRAEDVQYNIKDYLDGYNGFWAGLWSTKKDLGTLGLYSTFVDIGTASIMKKARDGKPLSDFEKDVLLVEDIKQESQGLELAKGRYLYKTGKGVGESLSFMGQFLIPGASEAGAAIRGAEWSIEKAIAQQLAKSGAKLTAEATAKLANIQVAKKVLAGAAEIGTRIVGTPFAYDAAAKKYIGSIDVVTDADGKEKVLYDQSSRMAYYKQAKNILTDLDYFERQLNQSTDTEGVEYKKQLSDINAYREYINNQIASIYDNYGKSDQQIKKEIGGARALMYGYVESGKEYASETLIGPALKAAGRFGGKFIPKKILDAAQRKVLTPLGNASDMLDNFATKVPIGKLTRNAIYHTKPNTVWNGLPIEMLEEVVVQATPNMVEEDWEKAYAKQLGELKTASFYLDVALQTIAMGGGASIYGAGLHAYSYVADKEYRDHYEKIKLASENAKKLYKAIDKGIESDELARNIIMATSGTAFMGEDYKAAIQQLRMDNNEPAADNLESRAFFNSAIQALQTNTLPEYKRALQRAIKTQEFKDPKTRAAAELSLAHITQLEEISSKYEDSPNRNVLMNAELNKVQLDKMLEDIQREINKPDGIRKFDAFVKAFKVTNQKFKDAEFNRTDYASNDKEFINALLYAGGQNVYNHLSLFQFRDDATTMYNAAEMAIAFEGNPKRIATITEAVEAAQAQRVMATSSQEQLDAALESAKKGGARRLGITRKIAQKKLDAIYNAKDLVGDQEEAEQIAHQQQVPAADPSQQTDAATDVITYITDIATGKQTEYTRQGISDRMKTDIEEREKELGKALSFAEYIEDKVKAGYPIEKIFNRLVLAWEDAKGGTVENQQDIFDTYFKFGDPNAQQVPPPPVTPTTTEVEKEAEEVDELAHEVSSPPTVVPGEGLKPSVGAPIEGSEENRALTSENPRLVVFGQALKRIAQNIWYSGLKLKDKESGNPVKNHYLLDPDFMYEVEQESKENPKSLTARQHDVDTVLMPTSNPERLDISFTGEDGTVYPIIIKKKSEDEEITWGKAKEVARNYFSNKPDGPKRYQQWVNQYVPVTVVYQGKMSNDKPVIISTLRDHQYYNPEDKNVGLESDESHQAAANNTIQLRNEIGNTKAKSKSIGFTTRAYGQTHRVITSRVEAQPVSSFGVPDLQLAVIYKDDATGEIFVDVGEAANGEKITFKDLVLMGINGSAVKGRKVVMLVKGEKTDEGKDRYVPVSLSYDSPSSPDAKLNKDYPAPLQATIKQAIAANILLNAKELTAEQLAALQEKVGINKTQADAIREQIKADFGNDITDPKALEDYIRSFSDGVHQKNGESTVASDLAAILTNPNPVDAFQEFTSKVLPKYELALNLKRLPIEKKVRLVKEDGNFTEARTYSQIMQDHLRSEIIVHPIETISGKTIGIIDVNPVLEVEALEGGEKESELTQDEAPAQVLKPAEEPAPLQVTKPKEGAPSVKIEKGQATELDNIITKLLTNPEEVRKMIGTDYAKANYILQFLQNKGLVKFKGGFSNAFLVSPDVKYEQLTKAERLGLALSYYLHSKLQNPEITNPIEGFPDIHFRMAYMLMTDKGIVMETPVIDFKENQVLVDDKTVLVDDKILSFIAQQVFETELNRIIASYKKATAFKKYAEASKLFHNIASFNGITIKTNSGADVNIHEVLKTLKGEISPNLRAKMIEAAKAKISSYIQSETNKKTEKGSEDKRREMAEFSVNNLLNQVAKQQIFLKDAAFYSNAKLPMTEEGQVDVAKLNDPRFLQDMADDLSAELQKAYNKALAAGEKLPDSKNKRVRYSQEFNHITLDGKINIDEYFKKFMPDTEIPEKGSTQFVTWPFYLEMLERLGKITPERRKELTKSIENKTATTEDLVKLQSKEFNPGKHTYTGEVYESGVLRPIHIEASFFPLFPQLTEGLPLDAIRASMEELEKRDSKTKEYIPVTASSKASFKIGGLKKGAVYNGSVSPFKVRLPISGFRLLPTEKAQGIALSPTHTFGSKAANERFKELYAQYSDLATKELEDTLGITTAEKNNFDELPEERQNIIISKMLDMLGVQQVFENGKTSAVTPLIFDSKRQQFDALLKDIVAGKVANLTIPEKAEYSALEKELIDLYKKQDVSTEEGVEMSDLNADLIDKKTTTASEDVSAFSDGYQNNNDGKIGEKAYTDAIALQQQAQELPDGKKVNLNTVTVSTSAVLESKPFVEAIGDVNAKGVLGENKEVNGALAEHQRVAAENKANQIMAKRNENFYTIPVYALMAQMGFNMSSESIETGFIGKDGKEYKGKLHIPSLFMNQPVIKRYVELMTAASTSSDPYAHEESVIRQLFEEFGFGKYAEGNEGTRDYMPPNEYKLYSKQLDARSLFIMLDPVNASQNAIKQQVILQKFLRFADKARELKRIQDLFNLTGTSYFDTIQKIELLNTIAELHLLAEEGESNNYTHLIGDVTDVDPKSQEYVKIGNFYWKAETIRGKQLINTLKLETKVMPSLFPYNSNFITGMMNAILEERGIAPSEISERNVKERQDIMNKFSAFINAKTEGMDSQKRNEYLRHVYDVIRDETLEDSEMLPFLRKEFIDDYFKRPEVDVTDDSEALKEEASEPEPKREGFQGYMKGSVDDAKARADVVVTESDKGIESDVKNPDGKATFVSRGIIGALSNGIKNYISEEKDFGTDFIVGDKDTELIEYMKEIGANYTIQFLGAFPENQASGFPLEGNAITQEDIKGLPKLPCE